MALSSIPFIPQINLKSYFFWPARAGALVIGYVGLCLSLALAVLLVVMALVSTRVKQAENDYAWKFWLILWSLVGSLMVFAKINHMMTEGIKKNKPSIMYPFIYIVSVCIIFSATISVTLFIKGIAFENTWSERDIIQDFFGILVVYGLLTYSLMVVISHCQNLIELEKYGLPVVFTDNNQ